MATATVTSKIGAVVRYCGHDGVFIADIVRVGTACVVRASGMVSATTLTRDGSLGSPTHHLVDYPKQGFWNPRIGVFVVPANQVRLLKE